MYKDNAHVSGTFPLVDWSAGAAPVSLSSSALAAECFASFFDLPVPIAKKYLKVNIFLVLILKPNMYLVI